MEHVLGELIHVGLETCVFGGHHRETEAPVVFKRPRSVVHTAKAIEALQHEKDILESLDGGMFLRPLGLFPSGESLALVFERWGEASLEQRLAEGPLPVATALRLAQRSPTRSGMCTPARDHPPGRQAAEHPGRRGAARGPAHRLRARDAAGGFGAQGAGRRSGAPHCHPGRGDARLHGPGADRANRAARGCARRPLRAGRIASRRARAADLPAGPDLPAPSRARAASRTPPARPARRWSARG